MEGDFRSIHQHPSGAYFNPLPPHGGRLLYSRFALLSIEFQSTPSAWRETDLIRVIRHTGRISIHSLRMEGDTQDRMIWQVRLHFNPLPPHGGRLKSLIIIFSNLNFNPLPPHGGRHGILFCGNCGHHFNPLPPHGGRRYNRYRFRRGGNFNPLPPHGGRHVSIF